MSRVFGGNPPSRLGRLRCAVTGEGDGVVVYLHGGAYVSNSIEDTAHNARRLAQFTGSRVVSLDYPLAPGSRCGDTTRLIVEAHRDLMSAGVGPADIAYYGDSAGGGLALGSILRMQDENVPTPSALAVLSPWTDLTPTGDSRTTIAAFDGVSWDELAVSAGLYAGEMPLSHPYASPVYGRFRPTFPPTIIQVGTREILLSDAVRLYQAMAAARCEAVLDVYDGMTHIWALAEPMREEAATALQRSSRFLRKARESRTAV